MTSHEEVQLCARKMELWVQERGTYSAENQAITAKLMAEPAWEHLDEEGFIKKVHDVFDRAVTSL
tara:strand:+ start:118 stop:312 length:195 start_codon:yes stop_codon:yes gene_type:complete